MRSLLPGPTLALVRPLALGPPFGGREGDGIVARWACCSGTFPVLAGEI